MADHLLVADVVVLALTKHGFDASSVELETGSSLTAVLTMILDDPPEFLLLDLDLGGHTDGDLFIAPAVRAGVEVVVMTANQADAAQAVETGARCLIPKTSSLADLVDTLESLVPGDPLQPAAL